MINNPAPLHPGQVLAEVYMAELGLNQSEYDLWEARRNAA